LCSDHFTEDDFVNPTVENKTLLVLKKTANILPLPSRFENNLQQNVEIVLNNAEKFSNYSRKDNPDNNIKRRVLKRKVDKSWNNEIQPRMKIIEIEPKIEYENQSSIEIERIQMQEQQIEEEEEFVVEICRLCTRPEQDLIRLFTDDGEFTTECECVKIMPYDLIRFNDGKPQLVCISCIEKLQSCVNTIDGFILNQDLFS
jgi:hypothetical protein